MKKILVIEDNNEVRENIGEILELSNYKVFTAENGKTGVEFALRELPDLIICDIMMPVLDGYGVLHLLKKNPDTENIPFIFLTAKTERTDFRKGMEMGADDFITKPFDDIELLNAIEIRLKKFDILHAKYSQDEKGASAMIDELRQSGLLDMNMDNYESFELSKKATLYNEGKRPKYLYYLKSGRIKAFRLHEDGKEYITNLFSPGDFIGYAALLENKIYDDSAQALETSEVVMIPKEEFIELVFKDMNIASKFIKLIAHNVQEKEERLLNLAYSSLRKRVAKALIDIHDKFHKNGDKSFALDISREDIAQYIGTATESLIRTLSEFKSEKLVEIKEGKIYISDIEKLKNLLY